MTFKPTAFKDDRCSVNKAAPICHTEGKCWWEISLKSIGAKSHIMIINACLSSVWIASNPNLCCKQQIDWWYTTEINLFSDWSKHLQICSTKCFVFILLIHSFIIYTRVRHKKIFSDRFCAPSQRFHINSMRANKTRHKGGVSCLETATLLPGVCSISVFVSRINLSTNGWGCLGLCSKGLPSITIFTSQRWTDFLV